jgi:hypothetical protein
MRYSIYNELRNRVICMSIVYDEISKGGGGGFDPSQLDPNKLYFKHLENQFLLEFLATNSTDFHERAQARKELVICARKLIYWSKQTTFSLEQAVADRKKIAANWNNNGR